MGKPSSPGVSPDYSGAAKGVTNTPGYVSAMSGRQPQNMHGLPWQTPTQQNTDQYKSGLPWQKPIQPVNATPSLTMPTVLPGPESVPPASTQPTVSPYQARNTPLSLLGQDNNRFLTPPSQPPPLSSPQPTATRTGGGAQVSQGRMGIVQAMMRQRMPQGRMPGFYQRRPHG